MSVWHLETSNGRLKTYVPRFRAYASIFEKSKVLTHLVLRSDQLVYPQLQNNLEKSCFLCQSDLYDLLDYQERKNLSLRRQSLLK